MPDDHSFINALRAGDPGALARLFDDTADRVYRLAIGLLQDPSEAEDIVQEAFIKVITRLDQFEGRSNLTTWLYRVAYNASMDRLRQRVDISLPTEDKTEEEDLSVPMPEVLVEWRTPEAVVIGDEDRAVLEGVIQQLPELLRTVFMLRDIEELSTAETAEVMQISPALVKVRLHRARLMLRENLATYFAERPQNVSVDHEM